MRKPDGYVLLVSAMIIGLMLIGLAVAATRTLISEHASTIVIEHEDDARSLAEGCADTALLKLRNNVNYTGNETVTINGQTCTIKPLLTSPYRLQTEATVSSQPYRLQITLSSLSPLTISAWQRVTSF
jgi:hypothetical protein